MGRSRGDYDSRAISSTRDSADTVPLSRKIRLPRLQAYKKNNSVVDQATKTAGLKKNNSIVFQAICSQIIVET